MTLYRTGVQRFKKYSAKYVPDTVGARFGQVKDVALERAEEGLILWESIQRAVQRILDKYGVVATQRALYLGFANKLLKHMLRHKGEAGRAMAMAIKAYYVQMGANPVILDEIINVVAGEIYAY